MERKGGLESPRVLSHQILALDNKWSITIQNCVKITRGRNLRVWNGSGFWRYLLPRLKRRNALISFGWRWKGMVYILSLVVRSAPVRQLAVPCEGPEWV